MLFRKYLSKQHFESAAFNEKLMSLQMSAKPNAGGVMRRHLLLVASIQILITAQLFGATTLPEMNISAPTTWYKAGNPYNVTGIISVDSGATLTIEAGVDIRFNEQMLEIIAGIFVERGGSIFAHGMPGDSVYLRGNGMIRNGFISNYGYAKLSYCRFENMNGSINLGAPIMFRGTDSSVINNCMFYNNTNPNRMGGAVSVALGQNPSRLGNLTIKDSYFYKNHIGFIGNGAAIISHPNTIVNISGCTFDSNYVERYGYGGAIHFSYATGGSIKNCIFKNNSAYQGGAIYTGYRTDSTFIIGNNLFYHNCATRGGAIDFDINSAGHNPLLLVNNTIAENSADTCGAINTFPGISPLAVNNIIWNNSAPTNPQASIEFLNISTYSCIEGYSDLARGVIDAEPLLAYPANHDYHLTINSPCINTGDPTNPQDPDYTRADMGAYYFQLSNGSGDVNNNCGINGLDIVYLVGFFKGRLAAPPILWKTDADGNCNCDALDVTYLVNYFKGKNRGPFKNTTCTWDPPPPPDQCGW
jgi:predicted outer membrane repeat protein